MIADIGVRPAAAEIVQAIISIGHALGIGVTAEGVETKDQQRFLLAAGCQSAQGFLFHRSVSAQEIGRMTRGITVAA